MLPEDIYKQFIKRFPQYLVYVEEWSPYGEDIIKICLRDIGYFVFTYHHQTDWRFETAVSFINSKKGGRTMNVGLHDNLHKTK